MKRVTIVRNDSAVIVDGVHRKVDCSILPDDVHAIQWEEPAGEIEFAFVRCPHCGSGAKKPNESINSLDAYRPLLDAWAKAGEQEHAA